MCVYNSNNNNNNSRNSNNNIILIATVGKRNDKKAAITAETAPSKVAAARVHCAYFESKQVINVVALFIIITISCVTTK